MINKQAKLAICGLKRIFGYFVAKNSKLLRNYWHHRPYVIHIYQLFAQSFVKRARSSPFALSESDFWEEIMKFLARLFAEIIMMIFVIIMAARVLNTEHPGVAGMILVAICVVILALRATIQREMIKDDADQRRRLERAFISAASEAGWPCLVKVDRDRKVVSYYIRDSYWIPDGDFYIELPLREESLGEQTQLADLLSPEEIDELYAGTDEVEDEDEEVNATTAEEE